MNICRFYILLFTALGKRPTYMDFVASMDKNSDAFSLPASESTTVLIRQVWLDLFNCPDWVPEYKLERGIYALETILGKAVKDIVTLTEKDLANYPHIKDQVFMVNRRLNLAITQEPDFTIKSGVLSTLPAYNFGAKWREECYDTPSIIVY